ncbi:ABC transporter permease [Paenibacillus chartarius]|uniref:ABC transporter permease n=1 Tax=Paenibacillus chartarius TaxID=747481 RepID=A0ABV6DQD3_9BACL
MSSLLPLVQNEIIKMIKKRRFLVIVIIFAALIPIFTYAQMRVAQNNQKQFGTTDWRVEARQQVNDLTQRLNSPRVAEEWKQNLKVRVQLLQYYLDRDIDPSSPNAVTFTREFVKNSITLFVPLIVMVFAADIVSSEQSAGTMKLLLTRPVRRWKILLSKMIALILFVSLSILTMAVLCYAISGVAFGYGGWTIPSFIGFQTVGSTVDVSLVRAVPQWLYVLMELGLVWFAGLIVAFMSLMLSVLIRSTAASMGTMLAIIISGTILQNMVSSWESAKYLFMVNLRLIDYLDGSLPPIKGMTLGFSLTVLSIWAAVAIGVSFYHFTRKDILN